MKLRLLFSGILSLFFIMSAAQAPSMPAVDSGKTVSSGTAYGNVFSANKLLNFTAKPVALPVKIHKAAGEPLIFWIVLALFAVPAFIRLVFPRYFVTLFRVFFNTSLRQNQLTDQLEQAKVPSLILNIFFLITAALYISLILDQYDSRGLSPLGKYAGLCVAGLGAAYGIKFLSLKFTGWVTGYSSEANSYIFIIFLLNKIIGIFLLPVVLISAFGNAQVSAAFLLISLAGIGLLMIMRFFRSYSLLQSRLKVSKFHFFLYIAALEVLPIAVLWKAALLLFSISP